MGIKTGTKHNIGTTHKEVSGWAQKAEAGEELRAGRGLYLRKAAGGAFWVYRYRSPSTGKLVRAPLWGADELGVVGFPEASLEQAKARAAALRAKVAAGVDPVEAAAQAKKDAEQAAALARQQQANEQRRLEEAAREADLAQARRVTVLRVFNDWRATDLQPRIRADGKRIGRVDGGQYVLEQFTRHIFPAIGAKPLEDVTKADLLALLDAQKTAGKMRTANVLLADLKQMLDFALEREIIGRNPLATTKKAKVGGADVERERVLADDEIKLLAPGIASANMHPRNATAIWLTLATGVRIGELMGAVWADALPNEQKARTTRLAALSAVAEAENVKVGFIDMDARTWHLPTTKNQRSHTIHLSEFALKHLAVLRQYREALTDSTDGALSPWVFPATDNRRPVCVKSFGKQLSDRQREPEQRLSRRTKATNALMLPGGRWTAHDLRRTVGTTMAKLGFSTDTINECLNHIQSDKMARVYIKDRREADQVRAFDALGGQLQRLTGSGSPAANVIPMPNKAA